MVRLFLSSSLFFITLSVSLLGIAQPDSTRFIQGVRNRYKIEYYGSSTITKNVNNQLKKPNYLQDTLSLKGLQLKQFRDSLTLYVQQLFPAQTWHELPEGHRIVLALGILRSGQVAELLSLLIPYGVILSGSEVEQLEELLKTKRVVVTDSTRYTNINFMALFFPIDLVQYQR